MHAAEGEIIMYTYILFFGWASFLSLAGVGGASVFSDFSFFHPPFVPRSSSSHSSFFAVDRTDVASIDLGENPCAEYKYFLLAQNIRTGRVFRPQPSLLRPMITLCGVFN